MQTILELLAVGDPQAPAILAPGREPITYAQLRETVDRLVGQLRAIGMENDDRVALVLPNGPEMAITFLAAAAGVTAAPLNPKYRENEFRFYLEDLNAKALITLPGEGESAYAAAPDGTLHLSLDGSGAEMRLTHEGKTVEPIEAAFGVADDVALVLHTSGTTSRPKIVPLMQCNLVASAQSIVGCLELTDSDRCLDVMPLFHIHGLVAGLLASLCAGGSAACPPGFDAFRFFDWLDELKPTWYTAVPTMHQLIVSRAGRHAEVIKRAPLRFARSSSASLPVVVLEQIERVMGVPMIEAYGMTEASHQMASNPLPPAARKPGSVGLCTGIEMAVMDEMGSISASGERGEVVIRGPTVTEGYENNPQANEATFTSGWFRTGDQGYLDEDGYLFLTGRLKEIINRGGEKISPLEVDEVLLRHPAVAQAAAFAVPHAKLGEEVAAAVVLAEGRAVTEREVREYCAEHLADFKVPRAVVVVDEIPKGPTGKLQRIGLAKRLGLAG